MADRPLETPAIPKKNFLHGAARIPAATVAAIAAALLRLPSLTLEGIFSYIHPDSSPSSSSSGLNVAIRRPDSSEPAVDHARRRHRAKSAAAAQRIPADSGDESNAGQLLRLRLGPSHLQSRLHFPSYRAAFFSFAAAASLLALRHVTAAVPALAAAAFLLILLARISAIDRSASDLQASLLAGSIGFLAALPIVAILSPSVFDFRSIGGGGPAVAAALSLIAGAAAGLLVVPASRSARAFWIGTDQIRWGVLHAISCSAPSRMAFHASAVLGVAAPLLWINPAADLFPASITGSRRWWLAAAAASQLAVLRHGVQMYVNESVICWYRRLHGGGGGDMEYARAVVFLHNHYVCAVAIQLAAAPVAALLLVGASWACGGGGGTGGSAAAAMMEEVSLFLAWWIESAMAVLRLSFLLLYRCRLVLVP